MSGDPNKVQHKKNKNDPKEQRKPRSARGPANLSSEQKQEAPKASEKPAAVEPGPEFYKNLKRETDEIIKITEESNAKYSKKIIQSNWKKYEAPIETYEEREEVESMGADFEELVNAPVSSGGHFQFKHEKSWDTVTKATQYDKYFEIDMNNLAISLSSIPFYERNDLDVKLFSQSDVSSMTHRSYKFQQRCQTTNEIEDAYVGPTSNELIALQECLTLNKNDKINYSSENNKENTGQKDINEKEDTNDDKGRSIYENDDDDGKGINKHLNADDINDIGDILECKNDDSELLDKDMQAEVVRNDEIGLSAVSTVGPESTKLASTEVIETEKNNVAAERGNSAVSVSKEDLEEWLDDLLSS